MQDQDSTTAEGRPAHDPFEDEALSELHEIRDRLQPLDVMEGLSLEQQFTLTDRVWLFDEGYRRFEGHPERGGGDEDFIRIQKVYRQRTPVQVKRLNKKLLALRQAADALIAEVRKIRKSDNGYLSYQIVNRSVTVSLEGLTFVPQAEHLAQLSRAIDLVQFPPDDGSKAPTAQSPPTEAVLTD